MRHLRSGWREDRLLKMQPTGLKSLLGSIALLLSAQSLADRVQIPFSLSSNFMESMLRDQAFTGVGDSVRVNDDGTGCQYLELRDPTVSTSGDRVVLQVVASARAGRRIGGNCLLALNWNGRLELTQKPIVGADRTSVLLRTESWRALKNDGSPDGLSTTIGSWLEQFLPADLRETQVSFVEPLGQLRDFLELVIAPSDQTGAIVDTLAIDDVSAGDDRATITLGMEVPLLEPPPTPTEPALSDSELNTLTKQLDSVDAFFTYTIKSINRDADSETTAQLLEVLMEQRYELLTILGEQHRQGEDPARLLFVDAWVSLAPTLRKLSAQQTDRQSALQYLTFIGAGDALKALDELGPAVGIEISTDGLRRLARILLPGDTTDPVLYRDTVDPELRKSFGFGPPLPPPQLNYESSSWLDWFIPSAHAADALDPDAVNKLNNWVPKSGDMDVYLPMVRDVLRKVTAEQLQTSELESAYHDLFRKLVLAAAWQESCWRQFVAKDDKRVPIQSGTGDIGMMQINTKVWRGFYDLQGLRWDIVYNARAGADILAHHLINYAIGKGEHRTTGSADNLARATYAAYNGGPRQYNRYRRSDASAQAKKVDSLFFQKYRAISDGDDLAVIACYRD